MAIGIPKELLDRARRWAGLKRWERKELGQELRLLGLSYGEIQKLIPVSKGSLVPWCRDFPLTEDQQERIRSVSGNSALARAKAGAVLRQRNLERVAAIRTKARDEAQGFRDDPFWAAGVTAYWAEGSKRSNQLQFSNSDSNLVRFFIQWGKKYLDLKPERFTIALHLHNGQEETRRKNFWCQVTGLSIKQFRKSFIKPEGTGHRKNILYNGTAQVRVTRSVDSLHRVLGWIDAISQRTDW